MAERDDGFLKRWARRKEQVQMGAEPSDEAPPAVSGAAPAAPTGTETPKTPAEQAEEQAKLIESLPDIDSMTRDSDFSIFMQKGVPRTLRNKALRKLWRLDPVFANLDGLNDYDEDYTAIGKGLGQAVNTLYQVGQGMRGKVPAPETTPEERAAQSIEQTAGAETADCGTEGAGAQPDSEATSPSESAESVPDQPGQDQPEDVIPATPGSADVATPGSDAARKGGRAAARRWGRFTT